MLVLSETDDKKNAKAFELKYLDVLKKYLVILFQSPWCLEVVGIFLYKAQAF